MSDLWGQSEPCPSGAGYYDEGDSAADDDETPQHEVHIRRGFRMGVHEVTLGQFKQYIAEAGRDDLLSDDFINYNDNGDEAGLARLRRRKNFFAALMGNRPAP